jgi:hypothetical protein
MVSVSSIKTLYDEYYFQNWLNVCSTKHVDSITGVTEYLKWQLNEVLSHMHKICESIWSLERLIIEIWWKQIVVALYLAS